MGDIARVWCSKSWNHLRLCTRVNSYSFIKSFRRLISRRCCPSNDISDVRKNLVPVETQKFVSKIGINWKINFPLASWQRRFFERFVRSANELLQKQLQNLRVNYEELQNIFGVESTLNNRTITYYYSYLE